MRSLFAFCSEDGGSSPVGVSLLNGNKLRVLFKERVWGQQWATRGGGRLESSFDVAELVQPPSEDRPVFERHRGSSRTGRIVQCAPLGCKKKADHASG
jgi:hypothetical protein